MVSGDAAVRSYDRTTLTYNNVRPVADRVSWACLSTKPSAETPGINITNTDCYAGLRAQLHFQSCWDGVNLYKSDNSHVAYMRTVRTQHWRSNRVLIPRRLPKWLEPDDIGSCCSQLRQQCQLIWRHQRVSHVGGQLRQEHEHPLPHKDEPSQRNRHGSAAKDSGMHKHRQRACSCPAFGHELSYFRDTA